MRNTTRLAFNAFVSQVAMLNGVAAADANKEFTVAPVVAQTLFEKVQLSSEFLGKINMHTVPQQEGQKVGIAITTSIAGRTDTSGGTRRNPGNPSDTSAYNYRCEKTNYDTALKYALLDQWGHRPEFQTLVRDAIVKRQGLDKMIIGWNGTSVAPTTDRVANPLLQDVNKGWIQHCRDDRPDLIVSHGDLDGASIYVSNTGSADYVNLDALVFDMIENLDEPFRDDTELVAICGRDLVHDKYFNLVNAAGDDSMKQVARDVLLSTKKLGGLPAVRVPYFPAGKLAITRLDNLSIYEQEGTQRRMIWEQPDLDRVCDFQSTNEAFVIEEYGLFTLAENIVMGPKA
jgi:P2 family phage major capsid protein